MWTWRQKERPLRKPRARVNSRGLDHNLKGYCFHEFQCFVQIDSKRLKAIPLLPSYLAIRLSRLVTQTFLKIARRACTGGKHNLHWVFCYWALPFMPMSTAVCPFSSCSCIASSISSVTSKPFCCIHSRLPIITWQMSGSLGVSLSSFDWLSAVQ